MTTSKSKNKDLLRRYATLKDSLSSKSKHQAIFEYREGITDGTVHSFVECGRHFGLSRERVRQLHARVKDELDSQSSIAAKPLPSSKTLC